MGNWMSVYAAAGKDAEGNAKLGDVLSRDAYGNLVVGDGAKVIIMGVENLVVVASPHGTLVAPLHLAADVKAFIEK
jgi:mannose-1-phosphate guanylyltransferase